MGAPFPQTVVAEEVHAFLAPSSAHRWSFCSGSAWMESQSPDLSDPEPRRLGTAAHWVFQFMLTLTPFNIGDATPNGVAVDLAMVQAASLLVADIEAKLRPHFGDQWRKELHIEQKLQVPLVHATHNAGTPDVFAWCCTPVDGYIFWLWDYKYGFSPVEVFENKQLINYTAGLQTLATTQTWPAFTVDRCRVVLTVVQPRAYHHDGPVRTWNTTLKDLQPYIHSLAMAADEATGDAPLCRPRPDVCHDCRARIRCKANQDAVYMGLTIAGHAVPREMDDEAVGLELAIVTDALSLMKSRATGLEELVKARIRAGVRVPHWTYGPGRGSTVWTVPEAEVITLGEMMGVTLAKPPEAITPTQAKAAGLRPEVLDAYSKSVGGAAKLMRDDGISVRKIFMQK